MKIIYKIYIFIFSFIIFYFLFPLFILNLFLLQMIVWNLFKKIFRYLGIYKKNVKILFLGLDNAGKTFLLNRIRDNNGYF
jgi:hypothetical protein